MLAKKFESLVCLSLLFGAACSGTDRLSGNTPSALPEADPVLVTQAEEILIFVRDPEGLKADDNLDPNSTYVDTLSESGQENYWEALHSGRSTRFL